MRQFLRACREARKFLNDKSAAEALVIYSEGDGYAPYIEPMIDELPSVHEGSVYYLTSDEGDRFLHNPRRHLKAYFIGAGSVRTHVFSHMRAKVLGMTMPDLNTFHIKRSPYVPHYTYFNHSLVSTHMVYRKGAFDHFDSVMCLGPFQQEEIREWEALEDLPEKQLFEHGAPPLDTLIGIAAKQPPPPIGDDNRLNVLVAPSWGSNGVLETRAEEAIAPLLKAGHFVHVRPHPMTRKLASQSLDGLIAKFGDHPNFDMNENIGTHEALVKAHVMVSDWSGAAMEFAFGLGKPVLFVDVPRKVNNPDYTRLKAVPLEVSYRAEVGAIIDPDNLDALPAALDRLLQDWHGAKDRIVQRRNELFFNLGSSARRGAEILAQIMDQTKSKTAKL